MDIDTLRRDIARHHGSPARLVQTHISWVILCGKFAYKIKKPVALGFLDFSSLDARRHFCEEEVRLNRRLAPSVYLDVVPVTGTAQAPSLDGTGPVLDHAVRMRRFPAGALFGERIASGRLRPEQVDAFAALAASFHTRAPVAASDSDFGTASAIESATSKVLESLARHEGTGSLAPIERWLRAETRALRPTWERRRAEGRVRECHGDLHLANVALFHKEVVAFDCIEFDPALRWIDVMSDVAFVVMDFFAHGRRDFAFRFLDAWLAHTGDHDGLRVLRYHMVYRALVRALVARLRGGAAQGPDYLGVAAALAQPGEPRLLVTHGLSGSGKSHAAQALLEQAGAVRLRSDVERKRLFGLQALQRSAEHVPGGIYGAEATVRTFAALRDKARIALEAGWPTIVDAAFLRKHERRSFAALAEELRVPFTILHCEAAVAVLRRRIGQRGRHGRDPSEADVAVLERQIAAAEPLDADEMCRVVVSPPPVRPKEDGAPRGQERSDWGALVRSAKAAIRR